MGIGEESDKSGALSEQNLLQLVMRRKQELPRPKLLRPCMNTKQNDLMKKGFFAQLEERKVALEPSETKYLGTTILPA